MIAERLQHLLDEGIDVDFFEGCDRPELKAYLGNLQAHRCRLDAVEANVVLALNRVDKRTAPKARPSDNADDLCGAGDSRADANKKTRRAELFERLPAVSKALAAGEITAGHADLLTGIPHKYQQALENDLTELLVKASAESVDEFRDTVRAWKDQTAKDSGEDPHKQRQDKRTCSMRKQPDGMLRQSALLHPEGAAIVNNAITNRAQQLLRQDQANGDVDNRDYGQRMADALIDICSGTHNAADNHEGERKPSRSSEPLVIVGIQLADLQAGLDGTAYGAGPISAETVRKLACEGAIIPMIFNSDSVVLDMGRKTRLATTDQRLALKARYENCCGVPGCDRPFEWCHIHHIDHWEHGGTTDLDKLIPVCTRHHTQIHDGRLQIERINGVDHWHRKSGRRPVRLAA